MFAIQLFLPLILLLSLAKGDYKTCPAATDCPGGFQPFSSFPGKIQTHCGPVLFSCDASSTPLPTPPKPTDMPIKPLPSNPGSWKPDLSWNPTYDNTRNGDSLLGNFNAPNIPHPSSAPNAGALGWLNGANWGGNDPLASQAVVTSVVGFVQNMNAAWSQRQYDAMARANRYQQPRQREAYMTTEQITAEYQYNAERRRAQMFERQHQSVLAENQKRAEESKEWREAKTRRDAEIEEQDKIWREEREKRNKAFEEEMRKIQLDSQASLERIRQGELSAKETLSQRQRLENVVLGHMTAVEAAQDLYAFTATTRSQKLPLRKRDLTAILSNYVDDRGLFRGFQGDSPLKSHAIATSIDSANGQNVRQRLNNGLILYEYATRKGDTNRQAKALLLIDEVLLADQLFGICETHKCDDNSYVLALVRRHTIIDG